MLEEQNLPVGVTSAVSTPRLWRFWCETCLVIFIYFLFFYLPLKGRSLEELIYH